MIAPADSPAEASPRPVTVADLERRLHDLRAEVADPVAGLYGPESKVWEVNREAVIFLGGGRAALLQLAHPFVAEAIAEHSQTETDPWGRFHRTFRAVFAMVYGDLEAAFGAARRVQHVHLQIKGRLREGLGAHLAGDRYRANAPDALLWVHATLWETSVLVYETIVRPLEHEEKDAYYRETRRFAALFGIEADRLPRSWPEFLEYNREMWESPHLAVGQAARETASFLFRPRSPLSSPLMRWLRLMTTGLLPPNLARDFGFPWGRRQRWIFERSLGLMRRTHWLLPPRIRFVPAYLEAQRRIRGDDGPDPLGRLMTRLWLGR